jgi:hypothetical protein
MTTETRQLETMVGKVSAVNEKGLKLEGRGDAWLDFTREEWRGQWERPERGDNVKLGMLRGKDDKWWVKTCEIQKHGNSPQTTYDAGQVPTGGKELLVLRESCVKSAAPIIAAWVSRLSAEVVFDHSMVSRNVLGLAAEFEAWMLREDIAFE